MKQIKKFLLIILLCMPIMFVRAEEEIVTGILPIIEDYAINKADFKAGDNFDTSGSFNGSAFYAGNKITSSSVADGIGFLAGNDVNEEGYKEYLIVAGNNIFINGTVKKDAIIAGNSIHISGNIGRDTYIAAASVVISGNIDRNVEIYADQITIKGSINGNVELYGNEINIEDTATINGYVKYNDTAKMNKSDKSILGEIKTYEVNKKEVVTSEKVKDDLYSLIISYINILIVALVVMYLFPKVFTTLKDRYSQLKVEDGFRLFGKGLAFLVVVPLLAIILLISSVGLSLGVIFLVLYFILCYISIILTGYLVGKIVLCKLLKKENNDYLDLLIGIAIIKLLELVPIIGAFVSIISLFVGLGIIIENVLLRKKNA